MKKKHLIISGLAAILMQSCLPGETPIPAHEAGDVLTASVQMGNDYKWQIYFDLKGNREVGKNDKTVWDLGFESASDGYRVILNNSRQMIAYKTASTDFQTVKIADTTGQQAFDSPSGSLDSTAIGDWRTDNKVYIINRANDGNGELGLKKIQFLSVTEQEYKFRVADMDGSNDQTITVAKDDRYNFTFISLTSGQQVTVEPPKDSWDIAFTQYTHIYYDMENTPYIVTGCLLNRHNTTVAVDTTQDFADISYDDIPTYTFSTDINTIGFDWKAYMFSSGTYVVDLHKNFIIRTAAGTYYKMHFIDFVSATGEKGSPRWEFQEL